MSEPLGAHLPGAGSNPPFLREAEMRRKAGDLLFFAYRDFTNAADMALEELGFGRAHHRVLHFVGRSPGITVSDLLGILRIAKQSLSRVLSVRLLEQGYVAQTQGRADRRQRLLTLTPAGLALERKLYERQRERLPSPIARRAPPRWTASRRVMRGIMNDAARAWLDGPDRTPRPSHVPRPTAIR